MAAAGAPFGATGGTVSVVGSRLRWALKPEAIIPHPGLGVQRRAGDGSGSGGYVVFEFKSQCQHGL